VVAPIGSPDEAIASKLNLEVITARDIAAQLAARAQDANKGRFGHVLVIGGSLGKAGAAALAGMGALRSGAGLVSVATARGVLPTVAGFAPELMTEPLAETESGTISKEAYDPERLKKIAENKSVVAIGPGISRHPDTVQFVRSAVSNCRLPVVLDADGLNAFEGAIQGLEGSLRPLVLTPHPGEMARLTGIATPDIQKDRIGIARKFAREHNIHLVLKGHRTVLARNAEPTWINPTGNPGMATGGTGDVLTGMIAGFIAQNLYDIPAATRCAVYLHGLAGDIARERLGEHSLVATDILAALPEAIRRARDWAEQKNVRI
jgi:NAD(P)H-hydrate epimerase